MILKFEVAKFLQDTLESTALTAKRKRSDDALPAQFVEFMNKVSYTAGELLRIQNCGLGSFNWCSTVHRRNHEVFFIIRK